MNEREKNYIEVTRKGIHDMDASISRRGTHFSGDVFDFMACQFALESGYGTSELSVVYHNDSGMKRPTQRKTFANNFYSHDRFAHYNSYEDCYHDYLHLLLIRKPSGAEALTIDGFMKFLVRIKYCPEPDYTTRILNIYKQFTYGKTK